jgi:uncharacterized protein (DUF2249 family)
MPDQTAVAPAAGASAAATNADVITAIRGHHAQLAEQLRERTNAVLSATKTGDCDQQRVALHVWYRDELMPHIVAEERALYSAGAEIDSTRLLVQAMLTEHKELVGRVAELALTLATIDVATTASAAYALFCSHLGKENDLLLPALDAASVDLGAALSGMHEILGHAHEQQPTGADEACGCGCGCGHDEGTQLLQIQPNPGVRDGDLDVRALPHGQRHEIIFSRLNALAVGETLVIVNDHDPKPLRYQTSAMWPDRYAWSYLDAGPEIWRVAISRAN